MDWLDLLAVQGTLKSLLQHHRSKVSILRHSAFKKDLHNPDNHDGVITNLEPLIQTETSQSPLDCKEIQPVHSEGDQPWDFFGRNDAKAEAPVLWPPHAKS